MTFIKLLNKLLHATGLQVWKKSKYRPVYGLDWIQDAQDILYARGLQPSLIMDIGANRGQTSKRLARGFPSAQVHCFEPAPSSCEVLRANMQCFPNATAHQLAFGPERKMGRFFVRKHHEESSFLGLEDAEAEGTQAIDIEMRSLDEYVPDKGWDAVDVLKINAEGYDLVILQGGRQLLEAGRIHLIFTEMIFKSHYDGQGSYMDQLAFMAECGYSLVGLYETASAPTGESMWSNGLFVKNVGPSSLDPAPAIWRLFIG